MQFRDLKAQYAALRTDIDHAVSEVMASGAFIMGTPVKELEAQLAGYVGVRHCITCANGTDALSIGLKVWGVGAGDAVFVPDFTFFSSAEIVSEEGATPIFVDVDERTFNISPNDLERSIRQVLAEGRLTPKVIIAVDLFGLPADYKAIREIADRYGLFILEDGAQGFGGNICGRRSCSFGDISTTSFFPAKPLGCYGDGGAVFTDNDSWAQLADSIRVHGKGAYKYDNVRIGMNSRLDAIQAAILQVKLRAFAEYELDAINKAAGYYNALLDGVAEMPAVPEGYYSSWAQYTIRLESPRQRDLLQDALKTRGIPSMVYYPIPMHLQSVYRSQGYPKDICPTATRLSETVLSLPIHPYISQQDIEQVCDVVTTTLKKS